MFTFWISSITILLTASAWLVRALVTKNDWRVFGPMGVLMMCYIYYCAIGPWILHLNTPMEFQGLSFYENIGSSALMALVSFVCVISGYASFAKQGEAAITTAAQLELRKPLLLFCIFFGMHLVSVGGNLTQIYNITGGAREEDLDTSVNLLGLQQYFYLALSCCVAPIVVIWGASINRGKDKLLAALLTANLMLVFLATGFRLRVVFLGLAIAAFMILRFRSNPNWHRGAKWLTIQRVGIIGAVSLAAVMAMSTARQYGRGINLDNLRDADKTEIVVNAFNDSAIYFCSGMVSDYVRDYSGHTWFETFKAAGLRMIPSAIIGEKPLPKTQDIISQAMGGSSAAYQAGFAIPFYTEHYISFGWPGVILGSLLIGAACAWLSNRTIKNPSGTNGLLFSLTGGYAFIFFHRGYFPQQLDYFMFMVGVPIVAFGIFSSRAKTMAKPPIH